MKGDTSILKVIPMDIDSDGTDELIAQLSVPDMMSPNIVIFYFDVEKIKRLYEGIGLHAIPYALSQKTDMHTINLGADVKLESEDVRPDDSDIRLGLLESVHDQQIGIVMFPKFYHIQMGPWPFLVDARHLHYMFDNCEKISFCNLDDIKLTSTKQILLIIQYLLTVLDIKSIDKNIGSVNFR